MANADGNDPQLVYAEDGRHIYGGHISPEKVRAFHRESSGGR